MGLWHVPFSDATLWICAGRIEIAQDYRSQLFACIKLSEDLLDHQFGLTVWIDRILWVVFANGNLLGNAIGGTSRRKYDSVDLRVHGGCQKRDGASHVMVEEAGWIGNRLP